MGHEGGSDPRSGGAFDVATILRDAGLRRLFDYWRGKRAGRPMPARADIDPVDIGWALSRLFLVDYSPEAGFRYRLAGAEIAGVTGRSNLKGLTLSDILPPEQARFVEERWLPVVRERRVVVMSGMVYLAAESTAIGERLLLPLADDAGGPPSGLLGMTVCKWFAGELPREVTHSKTESVSVDAIP